MQYEFARRMGNGSTKLFLINSKNWFIQWDSSLPLMIKRTYWNSLVLKTKLLINLYEKFWPRRQSLESVTKISNKIIQIVFTLKSKTSCI